METGHYTAGRFGVILQVKILARWVETSLELTTGFNFCDRSARFRWYSNYFHVDHALMHVPQWAIDNVYIGQQCPENCHGHGKCVGAATACLCDHGYEGETCRHYQDGNTEHFHETFAGSVVYLMNNSIYKYIVLG